MQNDKHHKEVSKVFGKIRESIILPVPAITEVAYFISRNLGIKATAKFLDEISLTDFILENPTSKDYRRAAEILRKYDDANVDFVDAIIVAIAERLNVTKILTVDRRHFGIFKLRHCQAFAILP